MLDVTRGYHYLDVFGRFEALFRFYGPEKPLFDKSWVLGDVEKI